MTNKDLFKEAIADAKQVREAALANAKTALEEALTPKLQSMLSMKLQEMEDSMDEEVEEGYDGGEELEEDFDLSAILAELEDETMDEAKEEEEEIEGEEEGEDMEVKDLSIDDLKDIIKDIISQELNPEEMEADDAEMDMEMGDEEMDLDGEEMMDDEDEINLDELLAELDALDESRTSRKLKENRGMDAFTISNNIQAIVNELIEQDRQDILNVLESIPEWNELVDSAVNESKMKTKSKTSGELKEAISTINILRSELQEVNLLNAKLLYVNKIFKAKNLTESQKIKVIESFDKATTTKEAKMIFESLEGTLTSLVAKNKATIKESLGFASKPAGNAPKKQIVEVNESLTRMQRLAGIID